MVSVLVGKYEAISSNNADAVMTILGFTDEQKKSAEKIAGKMEISLDGETITIKNPREVSFELNKEFDDILPNGKLGKSTATFADGKLTIKTSLSESISGTRTYSLDNGNLVGTLTIDQANVTATRTYKKL